MVDAWWCVREIALLRVGAARVSVQQHRERSREVERDRERSREIERERERERNRERERHTHTHIHTLFLSSFVPKQVLTFDGQTPCSGEP